MCYYIKSSVRFFCIFQIFPPKIIIFEITLKFMAEKFFSTFQHVIGSTDFKIKKSKNTFLFKGCFLKWNIRL